MTILTFRGITPTIAADAFIAPGCRIIGDVTIGPEASIWYNCVVRGDVNRITVGARSNIQDGSVVHVDSGGHATEIGDDCLIGHMAMVHGTKLHDGAFVGLGAIAMDGCEIEAEGMLGAGALLTPGKRIGARELWTGRPARLVRPLSEAELAANREGVTHYVALARAHRAALAPSAQTG